MNPVPKLGRVVTPSPLTVVLNGDTVAVPAEPYKGLVAVANQEVLVVTVEARRLVTWAAS